MSRFASSTSVSVDKSKAEIERILTRYGANEFCYMTNGDEVRIAFKMRGKMVQFDMSMPPKENFRMTPSGRRERSDDDMLKHWEQASRQRWRALALVIKAKLEAIESDIRGISFESEFLAHFVLPTGLTIGETIIPQLATVVKTGSLTKLIPAGKRAKKKSTEKILDAEFEEN